MGHLQTYLVASYCDDNLFHSIQSNVYTLNYTSLIETSITSFKSILND